MIYMIEVDAKKREFLGQVTGFYDVSLSDIFTSKQGSNFYKGQLDDLSKQLDIYFEKLDQLITKEVERLSQLDESKRDLEEQLKAHISSGDFTVDWLQSGKAKKDVA